jgi:VNT family MFS transporter (synaptic vesicle glycoprotein 2)
MTLDFLDLNQVEYEEAVCQTKFGKFHYYLLAICGLIYLNTAVGITIISFVLPSATCGECFSVMLSAYRSFNKLFLNLF